MGKWKNLLVVPREAHRQAETPFESTAAQIYEEYQAMLEEQNQIDFDDMLLLTWRLFSEFPDVLEACRARYRYLLVDEYQDTNFAQYTLLKMLGGEKPDLCVVGDDDQSIYSWRGADVGNILDFPDDFPGAKVIKLEQNYRSVSAILNAANMAIASGSGRRHSKQLWSALGEGTRPQSVRLENAEEEAKFICEMIRQIRAEEPDMRYNDFAVLYRSNQLSRQLEQTFRVEELPYRMFGGQPFFQRQEIKDAIAYLRLTVNPNDDQSLLRILSAPPRGLGGKVVEMLKERRNVDHKPMLSGFGDSAFLAKLSRAARESATAFAAAIRRAAEEFAHPGDLAGKCTEYLENVGYFGGLQRIYKDIEDSRRRRENVGEFISALAQFEARQDHPAMLEEYLDGCLLLEEKDRDAGENGDAVTLSTVHAAKGLEFPVVFVIALEAGVFPHERALEEGSVDEERRLFYVAITRAKQRLFLLRGARRMYRGVTRPARISPFLALLGNSVETKESGELIEKASEDELRAAFAKIYASFK
ncbi:MAG: UvrD-helicase domain-containing protein [Victivallaceae bacterium]|nr:UvrD-helicase domain-containing protein [Victivallaceae bacterium]